MRRLHSVLRKLRRIAVSDLSNFDKLRYAWKAKGKESGFTTYRLKGGEQVMLRNGTTDRKVFDEIFVERAYARCVAALPDDLGPVALLDLGANIGLSVLFLSRVLTVVEIIAVEPDPENFQLLSENLSKAGLAERTTALHAFAGTEKGFAELCDSGNGAWGMRMGALADTGIPVLPLADIAAAVKSRFPILVKCDIEGGERQLFLHIRDWDHLIRNIVLELHTEFLPVEEMLACLKSSRFRWTVHGSAPAGATIVLLLLERGERS